MMRTRISLVLFSSGLALAAACSSDDKCEKEGDPGCTPVDTTDTDTTSSNTESGTTDTTATSTTDDSTSGSTEVDAGPLEVKVLITPDEMPEEVLYEDDKVNLANGYTITVEGSGDAGAAETATTTTSSAADAGDASTDGDAGLGGDAATSGTTAASSGDGGAVSTTTTIEVPPLTLAEASEVVTDEGSIGEIPGIPYTFEEKCRKVTIPFTDYFQRFEFEWIFGDNPISIEGYDLIVPIKFISVEQFDETCRTGLKFYAKTGDDYVYGSAGWQNSDPYNTGTWDYLRLDTSLPEDVESGKEFLPEVTKAIGVGFDTACDASNAQSTKPLEHVFCVGEVIAVEKR